MAGKDDLAMLSAFVYSKVKGLSGLEDEVSGVGSVVMNRATSLGSLTEAIQTFNPSPEIMNVLQNGGDKQYKRVIQLTSKLLRGSVDPTGGAIELVPKRAKVDKSLGLVKAYATKHHTFLRPQTSGMQNVQKASL